MSECLTVEVGISAISDMLDPTQSLAGCPSLCRLLRPSVRRAATHHSPPRRNTPLPMIGAVNPRVNIDLDRLAKYLTFSLLADGFTRAFGVETKD